MSRSAVDKTYTNLRDSVVCKQIVIVVEWCELEKVDGNALTWEGNRKLPPAEFQFHSARLTLIDGTASAHQVRVRVEVQRYCL